MEALETAPPELTPIQRRVAWITAVVVALTRLWARSKTLWDWDEVQFVLGVRQFDVVDYHPHPPGFPLYILLGKLVHLFGLSEFHALQLVVIAGAVALFPVLFLLAREMRFPFETAWGGALLFAFLPNVWLFGGTAFSDIPALALNMAAVLMLLRGCRSRQAYFAGAVLLGLASAMRPQALLIGCCASLVASWTRRRTWRDIVLATVIGASIIAVAYAGAALASGSVGGYFETEAKLRKYLHDVDSFLSPDRPPLRDLVWTFFVGPVPGGRLAVALSAAALAGALLGAVKRWRSVALLVGTFLPFAAFGWLMLDLHSVSRYSVTYAPMFTVLAMQAVVFVTALVPRFGAVLAMLIAITGAVRYAVWSIPAIEEVRRSVSPPVLASTWVAANVPPQATIIVHRGMAPYAAYFLEGRRSMVVDDALGMPAAVPGAHDTVLVEGPTGAVGAKTYIRPRGRVFDVVRRRYFEASAVPAREWVKFGQGWYGDEFDGASLWQWMAKESTMQLPPSAGKTRLSLEFETLTEKGLPNVEVWLNGRLVERFACTSYHTVRDWIVDARSDGWNELRLVTDRTVSPAREGTGGDTRELGLCLRTYGWAPAER